MLGHRYQGGIHNLPIVCHQIRPLNLHQDIVEQLFYKFCLLHAFAELEAIIA